MANLKGGSYEKQINNAFHRLEAFGVSRHASNDHSTHSNALAQKREMYLRDYLKFVQNENYTDKLNQTMTSTNINKFLENRLDDLSLKTQTDYVRGWSSLVQGLQENNISISLDKSYFDTKIADIKSSFTSDTIKTDKAINNVYKVINDLYLQRFESGVIADVQNQLGLRVSEAIELVQNNDKYIINNKVTGLNGKGNHTYESKEVSRELIAKIEAVENLPHQNSYRNDIAEVTNNKNTPHSFRYNYAVREFESKLKDGTPYHQALKEVSEGLNHSREEMTHYYLNRA